jgi:capsular exopolysaccharide synthesis family protein
VVQESGVRSASSRGGRDDGGEQPIELRRYLDALRRWRWPIVLIILVVTGTTLAASLVLPKTYRATARILFDPTQNPAGPQNADAVQRELATISTLITTPNVLDVVAPRHGMTSNTLQKDVHATVDQSANIVNVSATSRSRTGAAKIANDVASTYIASNAAADRKSITGARAKVVAQIAQLGAAPNSDLELQALKSRLSDLTVAFANAGSEIALAESAQVPVAAASPRPVLNTLLAFFASSLLAILIAIGRDQLVPRIGGPRELTRITDRPVMVTIPYVRRRWGRPPKVLTAVEHEAYQTLQAALRFQLPPQETHIVLIASALEGEGKTTVTSNLGRALARAGRKTLLISADMRKPKLHESFGIEVGPGLAEILTALERGGDSTARTLGAAHGLLTAQAGTKGNLHVLPSGKKPDDPARLLLSPGLRVLLDDLRTLDYDYVIIDGTPLLGLADTQALAQRVDDVLVVSRLDRLTVEDAIDLRDLLDRIDVAPLGHVVVGVRRGIAYSYATTELE